MPTKNHIVSLFLIMTMLSSGAPLFEPAKSGVSDQAILANAVASVQNLARSNRDDASFAFEIKKALSSLQLAAGLKTVIATDVNDRAALTFFSSDAPFMISYFSLLLISYRNESIEGSDMSCQSLNNTPIPPPPRILLFNDRLLWNFKA